MTTSIRLKCMFVLCLMIAASNSSAGEPARPAIGWVGLYNGEMVDWLENQNRIDELCPGSLGPALQHCREEKLKPRTWTLEVRERPEPASGKIGTIVITAEPGAGLTAAFRSSDVSRTFTPDLFLPDWGYGPYFHQTFRDHRDTWYLLPRDPLPEPGWVDISRLTGTPDIRSISREDVYELDGNGIVLSGIDGDTITIRPEQAADMWCEPGEPPKREPVQQRDMRVSDLLTPDGHLNLKVKYMKGC